ncbi:helix-turn-helix domain-containing protein [Roseomonas fluvialis]|uniref:Helix-turn-helix domain-containing protein n=1 Tax=Roseomonas fluvialis TaxID=1750527 RepID=A0ABM7Y8X1_9PROT|nr:helix-turn-helix domain-containing protein [Roseomonas fluvialis]BDG74478.1 hypothetical protein Rmf_44070 [Roseomonas fluvialis]
MDSLITAAAQALAKGNPLGALKRIALREDAPALALRGIAMAQLGDLGKAKLLLRRAAKAFRPHEVVSRARCVVAEAEIALVSRDLTWPEDALKDARDILDTHNDRLNAAHARHLAVRRLLLIGKLDEAERDLRELDPEPLPPASRAAYELAVAGIAMRRIHIQAARAAFMRAHAAALAAGIPALRAEVERAQRELDAPAARLIARSEQTLVKLDEVETLLASKAIVVDACRLVLRNSETVVSLSRRPVLFMLARTLAEAWPEDASREDLLARAFRAKHADEAHRARLRVEMGRLRASLTAVAKVVATKRGFVFKPPQGREIVVMVPPFEDENAAVLACLADGEAWSSSALAVALGASERTIQRALDGLAAAGKVQSCGKGRARQWTSPPVSGFTTSLLLPGPLPGV